MAKNVIEQLDSGLLAVARDVGEMAARRGAKSWIVGGIVRDLFLKRKNMDLDIVIEKDSADIARAFAKKYKARHLVVHERFQTAGVVMQNGFVVDFAVPRKEIYSFPGALPEIEPGTMREDFSRRDFTINALALSIYPGTFGEILDECGGIHDLQKKIIRVFHDESFEDDPTRILRAVRFEQRLKFSMERRTLGLIKEAVRTGAMKSVQSVRLYNEYKKILREKNSLCVLKRLNQLHVLGNLWDKKRVCLRAFSNLYRKALKLEKRPHWLLYFLALIEKLDLQIIDSMLKRIPFKKEERQCIVLGLQYKKFIDGLKQKDMKSSDVYQLLHPLPALVLDYIELKSSDAGVLRRIKRYRAMDSKVCLSIDGDDVKPLGFSGQEIGAVLKFVLSEKIDRNIKDKEEEMKLIKKYLIDKEG